MTAAIEVANLRKEYGPVVAVDGITFDVQPGEMVGFLGPNGAGKSTTMKILTTILPATSGVARVCGHDVFADSMKVRESIGYLPESVPIYPEMRIEEYLIYRAKLKGIDRGVRSNRLEKVLQKCRIREVRRRLISTLSKGYRQRVGLADALLSDPQVLILDEPTSGLDPIQIRETLETIRELSGSHAVLLSTHILSEVEAVCDRVVIINRGSIGWDGQLSRLTQQDPKLIVEVRGPRDAVGAWLRSQSPDARDLSSADGAATFELPQLSTDQGERLAKGVIEHGWGLRRLEVRRRRLDDLYSEVVRGGSPSA